MARVVNTQEIADIKGVVGEIRPGWSFQSWPRVDESRIDRREQVVATHRMLWRRDHSLACPIGDTYALEDLPLLMTQDEFDEAHSPKKRKRR